MAIDIQNETNFSLKGEFLILLESILESIQNDLQLEPKDCELIFLNNPEIKKLNAQFRGIAQPTDVLSFPLDSSFSPILGSVVISIDFAEKVSQELKHSTEEEIALLFIHGILHLVGFDHENDSGEHRALEAAIASKFHLPNSLIVRTEEKQC